MVMEKRTNLFAALTGKNIYKNNLTHGILKIHLKNFLT